MQLTSGHLAVDFQQRRKVALGVAHHEPPIDLVRDPDQAVDIAEGGREWDLA